MYLPDCEKVLGTRIYCGNKPHSFEPHNKCLNFAICRQFKHVYDGLKIAKNRNKSLHMINNLKIINYQNLTKMIEPDGYHLSQQGKDVLLKSIKKRLESDLSDHETSIDDDVSESSVSSDSECVDSSDSESNLVSVINEGCYNQCQFTSFAPGAGNTVWNGQTDSFEFVSDVFF